ncbi:MAG: response regulator, partial [Pseudomonadota bacterium]|nr:response regulator [Pseudomonadota bacterium]
CKKIRDDKGYWNQIETYIRDHSEADFSHGICPECARKEYPELFSDTAKRKRGK